MGELVSQRKRVKHAVEIGTVEVGAGELVTELDARIEAIQLLIPLGLEAVREELQRAVVELAGSRYQRKEIDQHHGRWGSQPGSVYLADQKVPVAVPRVRNVDSDTEVPLDVYHALQTPRNGRGSTFADVEGHRHTQLRGLRRGGARGFRLVTLVGLASLRERHGSKAGPVSRALLGRVRSGGSVSRRQELCGRGDHHRPGCDYRRT